MGEATFGSFIIRINFGSREISQSVGVHKSYFKINDVSKEKSLHKRKREARNNFELGFDSLLESLTTSTQIGVICCFCPMTLEGIHLTSNLDLFCRLAIDSSTRPWKCRQRRLFFVTRMLLVYPSPITNALTTCWPKSRLWSNQVFSPCLCFNFHGVDRRCKK